MSNTPRSSRRRLRAVVVVALLSFVGILLVPLAGQADSHGVVRSVPEDQSIVPEAPAEILIEFEGLVQDDQADVRLYTNRGVEVALGDAVVSGGVIRRPVVGAMDDGIYQVLYTVNTEDPGGGSFTEYDGTIRFTVRGGACAGRLGNVGMFTSIKAPDFASPPNVLRHASVDKNFQTVIYATNGRELQRTLDGCSWEVVLDLASIDNAAGSGADAIITQVVTAREVPGVAAVLVLDPTDEGANIVQPRIWVASSVTGALVEGGVGLEPIRVDPEQPLGCGHPQPCHLAFSDAPPSGALPDLFFLTEPAYELGAARLFRSADLGATFTTTGQIVTEGDLLGGGGLVARASGLAPDAEQPNTVYISTGRSVHVSFNRGDSFTEAFRLSSTEGQVLTQLVAGRNEDESGIARRDVMAVLQADTPDAPAEAIVRLVADGNQLVRGRDLDVSPLRGARITTLTRGAAAGQVLILPERDDQQRPGVYEYEASVDGILDLDSEEVSPWINGQATSPICTRWFGHTTTRMYLIDADDGHDHVHSADQFCTQPDAGGGTGIGVDIVKFPPAPETLLDGTATLAAATDRVELDPGIPKTVGYVMSRAARDVPVDIAFLFDTSGSMRDNAEAVRAAFNQIVSELQDREIDAWFGLAEFKDLTLRYRRLADVQPPGDNFASALARMQVNSGDNEPHFTALQQLATGKGMQNPSRGTGVNAGQQMNWRPDAVRIVIMASDERVFDDPDGPTFTETVADLNAKEIHHIGMHIREEVGNGNSGSVSADNPAAGTELLTQMRELSAATEAYARKPIDCDGDGTNDINLGEPLVCTLPNTFSPGSPLATSTALATAVVDLVDSIELLQGFTMQAPIPSGFTAEVFSVGLNADVGPTQLLDVTLPQRPRWAVRYGCSEAAAGRLAIVPVGVALKQLVIAEAKTTVACGTPAVAGIPEAIPAAAVAIAAPPPPPPAPIPANAPAPTAGSANAFAQSAATSPAVGAAAAPQMEQQTQKAQIRDDDGPDLDLAYSTLRQPDTGPQATLMLGFVMAVGAGVALSRQRASRHQHARSEVRVRR